MKVIDVRVIEETLDRLNADEASQLLIINNVELYNDLVNDYLEGNRRSLYLTYQLNVQINKQLMELIKINSKNKPDEEGGLKDLIKSISEKD